MELDIFGINVNKHQGGLKKKVLMILIMQNN